MVGVAAAARRGSERGDPNAGVSAGVTDGKGVSSAKCRVHSASRSAIDSIPPSLPYREVQCRVTTNPALLANAEIAARSNLRDCSMKMRSPSANVRLNPRCPPPEPLGAPWPLEASPLGALPSPLHVTVCCPMASRCVTMARSDGRYSATCLWEEEERRRGWGGERRVRGARGGGGDEVRGL